MKSLYNCYFLFYLFMYLNDASSQPVYFSNRYNLCQNYGDDAWSGADGIIEVDDGYLISGYSVDTIYFWWRRIPIMKVDFSGNAIWKKSYGDTIADYYSGWPGSFLKSTSSSEFYIAGSKNYWQPVNYDVGLLMKLNSLLDTVWTKEYDLNNDSNSDTSILFNQMSICNNNDLIFGGTMNGDRMLLLRTDSLGNMRWYKTFHLDPNTLTTGYSVIQTTDGGFALGGFSYYIGNPESGDPIIIKTDSLGNQEWIKYLGGNFLDNRAMLSLAQDGSIVMGSTYGESMSGDDPVSFINLVKLDNDGTVIWDINYGLSCKYNYLFNVRALPNGDIIATGRRPDDFPHLVGWIIKVNSDGDELWYREYSHLDGPQSMNQLSHVIETSDNGYIACGYVNPFPPDTGNRDAWVIKLDSLGCDTAGCDTTVGVTENGTWGQGNKGSVLEVWPNPASSVLSFKVSGLSAGLDFYMEIYDIFGRKIEKSLFSSTLEGSFDVSSLPPGLFLLMVKDGQTTVGSAKFLIAR